MRRLILSIFLIIAFATQAFAGYTDFKLTQDLSGGQVNFLKFYTDLLSTDTILRPNRGSGVGSFSRSSSQYITDFEGNLREVKSGSVGVEGSRVVTNLLTYSEDLSNAAWQAISCTKDGNIVSLTASGVSRIRQDFTAINGASFRLSARFAASDVGKTFRFSLLVNGATTYLSDMTVPASGRSSILYSPGSTVSVAGFNIGNINAGAEKTLTVVNAQLENVTAQTSTAPGEYVKTTSAPVSKCFATTNGNTVDANGVVTEAQGTALPQSYPDWQAAHTYAVGDKVQSAGWWYQCTVGGQSGGSAPTWPQGKAGQLTVVDNAATWSIGGRLLLGVSMEPASSNKTTAYGTIPADTLGSELVTVQADREFSSDTGFWTKTGSTTISGGVATIAGTANQGIRHDSIVTLGKIYQVTYTITRIGSGSIKVFIGSGGIGTIRSTTGTFTENILCAADTNLRFWLATSGDIDIDNVSVKEVTWAVGTKSYYTGSAFQQNISGLTLSGDQAAVLSIVDDTTELTKAGLLGIAGYKAYKLDNSGGSGYAFVAIAGTTGNTNSHSGKWWGKKVGSGLVQLGWGNTSGNEFGSASTAYAWVKGENKTPSASTFMMFSVATGQTLFFLLPQLEELPYSTSVIPTSGSTSTRSATSLSYPTAGNLRGNNVVVGVTVFSSAIGNTMRFFGTFIDSNNRLFLGVSSSSLFNTYKILGGVASSPTNSNLPITANTLKTDVFKSSSVKGSAEFSGGVKGNFPSATTDNMALGTNFYVGQDAPTPTNQYSGYLRNLRIYWKDYSDAWCVQKSQ